MEYCACGELASARCTLCKQPLCHSHKGARKVTRDWKWSDFSAHTPAGPDLNGRDINGDRQLVTAERAAAFISAYASTHECRCSGCRSEEGWKRASLVAISPLPDDPFERALSLAGNNRFETPPPRLSSADFVSSFVNLATSRALPQEELRVAWRVTQGRGEDYSDLLTNIETIRAWVLLADRGGWNNDEQSYHQYWIEGDGRLRSSHHGPTWHRIRGKLRAGATEWTHQLIATINPEHLGMVMRSASFLFGFGVRPLLHDELSRGPGGVDDPG